MEDDGSLSKEEKQNHHYFLLKELQCMARELPGNFQQRLSYDLLSSLASAMLDGTVFEIVKSLKEVQQLEERNLFNQRTKVIQEQKAAKVEMQKKHKDLLLKSRPHTVKLIQTQIEKEAEVFDLQTREELKRRDMKVILELDQKVMDQQVTLEKAGVPGFYVTNKPNELKLQMYLLNFITTLGHKMEKPS